jgi:hypothetical protein
VTAKQISESVNVINTEDVVRYLPNILIRKRHIGDTQAPMTTRTSGVGASARSLIMVDGALLSPLIANNNNVGGPRWGMVSPKRSSASTSCMARSLPRTRAIQSVRYWTSRPVCRSSLKQA